MPKPYDSAKAQAQLAAILAQSSGRTRALAKSIAQAVAKQAQSTNLPVSAILEEQFRTRNIEGALRRIVSDAVTQSVAAGYGVLPSVSAKVDPAISSKAASLRWDASGLTLSQQVHGTAQGYRQALDDSLRQSFADGRTVRDAARAIYDGYQPGRSPVGPFAAIVPAIPARGGNAPEPQLPQDIELAITAATRLSPGDHASLFALRNRIRGYAGDLKQGPLRTAYLDLASKLQKVGTDGFERAVWVATEEKARYFADRIARTEAARAWGAGFHANIESDARVVGVRSRTSSAHKVFDICDFHARADLYEMGAGCYPKDRAPAYPYHPHCTCLLSPIYRQRPSEPPPRQGGPSSKGGVSALRAMRDYQRKKLLTINGASQFALSPDSWAKNLRMWTGKPTPPQAVESAKVLLAEMPVVGDLPREYVPSSDVAGVEASIKALGVQRVDLKGMALQEANEVARALHRMIQIEGFPAVPEIAILPPGKGGGLCRFATSIGTNGTWIKFGRESFISGKWEKEKRAANNAQKAKYDEFRRNVWIGETPPKRAFVSESIYDTTVHEYGYFMHGAAFWNDVSLLKEPADFPGFEILTGKNPKGLTFHDFTIDPDLAVKRRQELSWYAGEKPVETFAEAFNMKYSKGEVLPDELERLVAAVVAEAGNRARTLGPFQPWSFRKAP